MTVPRVALLFLYRICSPRGLEIYLQLHSDGKTWRFFGGHLNENESPLHAAVREAHEELDLRLNPQELGEGWTPLQLISRLRLPAGRVFMFPIEVNGGFPPPHSTLREGVGAGWWPVRELPPSMSPADKLLAKLWMLRRQILNQPYIQTGLSCPVVTIDLEEPHHLGGRLSNARFSSRDSRLSRIVADLLACLKSAGAKATFFCVALTARKYPDVVRSIARAGHEIGSHGVDHELVRILTPAQFTRCVALSKQILEDIAGIEVSSFRAAGWSWPRDPEQSARFYEALRSADYQASSSVIPASGFGFRGLPSLPYETAAGVWEFPLTVFRPPLLSHNIDRWAKDGRCSARCPSLLRSIAVPYSGGLFLRCLGPGFARMMLSYHLKKRGCAMVYAHPGELGGLDARWIRSLDGRYFNLAERWRQGFRSKSFWKHFRRLICESSGCSIRQFLATLLPASKV